MRPLQMKTINLGVASFAYVDHRASLACDTESARSQLSIIKDAADKVQGFGHFDEIAD